MPTTQEGHVSGVGRGNPGFRGERREFGAHTSLLRHDLDLARPMGPLQLPRSHGARPAPSGDQGWPPGGRNSATATPSLRYDLPGELTENQDIMLTTEDSV